VAHHLTMLEVWSVNLEELRSRSRRHEVVRRGEELSRLAVMANGYSGAKVMRFAGVTNSCITCPPSSKGRK
jgi:hypothetical protein